MNDADYMNAFNMVVMPLAHAFQPELVIISAGFDAADGDPLGQMRVSPRGCVLFFIFFVLVPSACAVLSFLSTPVSLSLAVLPAMRI
jgi:hypothetical protein|tara:strand:- start:393 stop:653 length:261 start_codon:yes stop_codon:yes gene_type:complete